MDLREEGCTYEWNWPGICPIVGPIFCGVKSACSANNGSFRYDRNRQEVD